jgi:hypothetical protein
MNTNIETQQFTVGSSAGCELRVQHSSISNAHAKIYFSGDSILIEDLNSKAGTFVLHDGEYKRIKSAKVRLDTLIRFGPSMEGIPMQKLIEDYKLAKEVDKKDLFKKVKSVRMKRCGDCGNVLRKEKAHCECCGAVFEESA